MMIARILSRRRPRSFPLVSTRAVLHLVQLERCRLALFCGSCLQFLVTIHGPKESVSCFSWRMGCCGSEKHLSRALLISSLLSMARFFDRLNSCFSECFAAAGVKMLVSNLAPGVTDQDLEVFPALKNATSVFLIHRYRSSVKNTVDL